MGTTTKGLPYPDPTDGPATTDLDIAALANALDPMLPGTRARIGGPTLLSFNSSGEAVLTHGLGVTPAYLHVYHDAATGIITVAPKVGSYTNTTVTIVGRTNTGAAYTSGLTARWLAIA